jgi:hypothetical protein
MSWGGRTSPENIISQLCGNKFRRRVRAGPAPAGLVFGVPTVMFVVYALVDGLISFILALRTSDRGARRWLPLAELVVGVLARLAVLLWSGMTVGVLLYVTAVRAVMETWM